MIMVAALLGALATPLAGQSTGSISGTVVLAESGNPLNGASVLVFELGRTTVTEPDGTYSLDNLPPGTYRVHAHMHSLFTDVSQVVQVSAGEEATLDFRLTISTVKEEITVTASGRAEAVFDSISSVDSFDAGHLAMQSTLPLAEALENQVGASIAKRGFGPGASRPIIRGFDGDRVLIMQDGLRTGTLSSQAGDHGEVLNVGLAHRVEVVQGPAALLYSGNAVGGAVNVIDGRREQYIHPEEGLRGYLRGAGGTTNSLASGSAGFEYGIGRWMLWGDAGSARSGDYNTPEGPIYNSRMRMTNGGGGFGWFGSKAYFSVGAKVGRSLYGVPFLQDFHGHHDHGHDEDEDHEEGEHHEEGEDHDEDEDHDEEEHHEEGEELDRVTLDGQRTSYRVDWGLQQLGGPISDFSIKLNYVQWQHDENEAFTDGEELIATTFKNNQFVYRGQFEQRRKGVWGGRFGIWGIGRDFDVTGEEGGLAPQVDQRGLAFFALEEFQFERVKLEFGARVENQRYTPAFLDREAEEHHHDEEEEGEMHGDMDMHEGEDHDEDHDEEHGDEEHGLEPPATVQRAFTGMSASAGIRVDTWNGGAFVGHFTRSYRAPALEELYFYGAHAGTRSFDVGDATLAAETGIGMEGSLRHRHGAVQGEINFFLYDFANFIFPFSTGETMDELQVIEFTQLDARYAGAEAELNVALHDTTRLKAGMDFVDARSVETNTPLPRIPPLRGKFGLELAKGGFRLEPELIIAGAQNDTFVGETRTPGYAVLNLAATYTYARPNVAHQFSLRVFNMGDRLYRNHSSFIKDLAPEIGRGLRVGYTLRFF